MKSTNPTVIAFLVNTFFYFFIFFIASGLNRAQKKRLLMGKPLSNLLGLVNNLLKSVAFFALVFATLFFFFLYFFVGNLLGFFIFLFLRFRGFCGSGAIGRLAFAPFAQLLPAPWALACWAVWFWLAAPCVCANKAEAAINDAKTKNSFNDFFIFFLFGR